MSDRETFKKGYEACLKNAELWLNEGKLLYENRSYGHACALYIHGLEGLIHAYWSWLVYIEAVKPDNKDFLKMFRDHQPKLQSIWSIFIGRQQQTLENDFVFKDDEETWKAVEKWLKEFHTMVISLSRDTLKFRNKAIYVDYSPEKFEFKSPLDIPKKEADYLIKLVSDVYDVIFYMLHNSKENAIEVLRQLNQAMYKEE